jgi:ribose transport system permease protein
MIVGISEKAGVVPGQDDGPSTPVAFLQRYGREVGLPVIVIVMAIFFSIDSNVFLSLSNFRNIGFRRQRSQRYPLARLSRS